MASKKALLVCVDGSPQSDKAFETVLQWKKPEEKLFVVHAVEYMNPVPIGLGTAMAGGLDPALYTSANEALKERGMQLAQHYANICKQRKIQDVTTAVLTAHDSAKDGLIKYAADNNVGTIFVGTRGMGMIKRMILGSFSRYIVEHAHCDVVVVRHESDHVKATQ